MAAESLEKDETRRQISLASRRARTFLRTEKKSFRARRKATMTVTTLAMTPMRERQVFLFYTRSAGLSGCVRGVCCSGCRQSAHDGKTALHIFISHPQPSSSFGNRIGTNIGAPIPYIQWDRHVAWICGKISKHVGSSSRTYILVDPVGGGCGAGEATLLYNDASGRRAA